MALQEPSNRERRMYYYGLPSGPRLVARSSTTPWSQPREWPERKKLGVATGHKIQQPWNDLQGSLQQLIINTLSGIDWTAIDILRVSYEDTYEDKCPVTMLISVSKDSTSFRQAEAAIIACRDILIRFGLDDVEVEMKESIVSTAASSPGPATSDPITGHKAPRLDPGPFDNDISDLKYNINRDISEYIGTSIASTDGFKQGTKGLYLQSNNGKTYALTCRHVLFSDNDCKEYRYQDGHNTITKDVIQPRKNILSNIVEEFRSKKEALDLTIDLTAKPLYNTVSYQALRVGNLREQTLRQSCQPRIDQFDQKGCAILGHVVFSPPIELCSQRLRLRDWALIELSQDIFTTKLSELRNKVPVTQKLSLMLGEVKELLATTALRLDFTYSLEVAIGPRMVPESDLEDALSRTPTEGKGLIVIKHGFKTGFTIGRANGIRSVIRYASEAVGEVISSEWCIIGIDKAFSEKGDSGACIFDLEGRIGGMITAGLEAENITRGGYDVTYAAPMQWLLDDIKRQDYDIKLPN
ncbi:uncharacterized protein BKA55DRAFT_717775 [Fusarium redolens]|uniref:Serine protease n=1 Tax=Fusarium redolens TaxID=48865 RepID=A0A9P9JKZ1_FUSRE|nr:uncharacterized protein BKA55DRAFT_717775 [Fusarium redolens]KAH7216865.1 hypothetical protein BKA55DRAFT_717775 [Fusarium redolens]